MSLTYAIVLGWSVLAVGTTYAYFRQYSMQRPPIGVMNRTDSLVIVATIIVAPFVYLMLPLWAGVLVLVPSAFGIVYFALAPATARRLVAALSALVLVGADLASAWAYGQSDDRFLVINNLVIVFLVIGVSNIWVQSGMRARHLIMILVLLSAYDFVATAQLPLMTDLLGRVSRMPLVPDIAWVGGRHSLAIGVGDLVVAATFALVMRKAYGRIAGMIALLTGFLGAALALGLLDLGIVPRAIPVVAILGPLDVIQYVAWSWRRGSERTMRQYLEAEPMRGRARGALAPNLD